MVHSRPCAGRGPVVRRRRELHEGQNQRGDEDRQPLDPQGCGAVPQDRDHRQDRADPDEDEEEQLDLPGGKREVHARPPPVVPFGRMCFFGRHRVSDHGEGFGQLPVISFHRALTPFAFAFCLCYALRLIPYAFAPPYAYFI